MNHCIVTEENIDVAREGCVALDQRAEITVGCETWGIIHDGGQRGQMTVWPDAGTGAVMWGGDSEWGDWDVATQILTLNSGVRVDDNGEPLAAHDEEAA